MVITAQEEGKEEVEEVLKEEQKRDPKLEFRNRW